MVGAGRRGDGELVFNGDRDSVLQEAKEMGGGDVCITI